MREVKFVEAMHSETGW